MARHRPKVGSDKNPILTRCKGQHVGIGNPFQPRFMSRKKVDRRLTAKTPGDNRMVETGIARKRIICQLRRETVWRRKRSSVFFTSGAVGWATVKASSSRSRSTMSFSTSC